MAGSKVNIIFLGEDESFFNIIKKEFQTRFPGYLFNFQVFQIKNKLLFKQAAKIFFEFRPHLVFLDFENQYEDMIRLSTFLRRTHPFNGVPLIGLIDKLPGLTEQKFLFCSGVNFVGFKNVELQDITHFPLMMIRDSLLKLPPLAVQARKIVINVRCLGRIGYFNQEYLHGELPLDLKRNETFKVLTHFKQDNLPEYYQVERKSEYDLYYHYGFSYDFKYIYKNKDDSKRGGKKTKSYLYYEAIFKEKEVLEKYYKAKASHSEVNSLVQAHAGQGYPKRSRVMILDKDLSVLDQAKKDLDEYDFSIRAHTHIDQKMHYLEITRPGIIVMVMDQNNYMMSNNEETLKKIILRSKKMYSYTPRIIALNCAKSTQTLQAELDYDYIISDNAGFDWELILQYIWAYEEKQGVNKTHGKRANYHDQEKRIYLRKKDPASVIELDFEIKIKRFSESYVIFESDIDISAYSQLITSFPRNCYLTVLPQDKKTLEYTGLIQGLNEQNKKDLRKDIIRRDSFA